MGRKILLGFAGPGKTSHTNVKDLLADYLNLGDEDKEGLPTYPDDIDEIKVILPASDEFLTGTVKLLWEWTHEYGDFPYEAFYDTETRANRKILDKAEEAIETRNVGLALVERLVEGAKNGDEVTLIVAWGEAGDDYTEPLVDLAQAKDIKVLDITAGLDDLVFGDPEEDEPEPEPVQPARRSRRTAKEDEPEPEEATEEPRPRRGKPRTTAETSPEPAEAAEPESVEQEVAHARQSAQKAAEAPEGDVVRRALGLSRTLVASLDMAHAAMTVRDRESCALFQMLDEAIVSYDLMAKELARLQEAAEGTSTKGGRPRSDGTPARTRSPQARGVKEWLNEDGEWVKAGRGRLPKNVKTRTVDPKTGDVLSED